MTTIAEIVDEWFQEEPTVERQQNIRRISLVTDLEHHYADHRALADLRAAFAEANGSSNDIAQMLDDFLTSRGLPTVLYV